MVALDLYVTVLIFVKKKKILDRIAEGWKDLFGLAVSEGTLRRDGEGMAGWLTS